MAESTDTSRSAVKTYVPTYQKRAWQDHAESLDMSQSEFVRTMVQAGRRSFDPDDQDPEDTPACETADTTARQNTDSAEPPAEATQPLDERVLDVLDAEGPLDWDALVEAVTDDIEGRLEATLDDLQAANRIKYSGREGGYTPLER